VLNNSISYKLSLNSKTNTFVKTIEFESKLIEIKIKLNTNLKYFTFNFVKNPFLKGM